MFVYLAPLTLCFYGSESLNVGLLESLLPQLRRALEPIRGRAEVLLAESL